MNQERSRSVSVSAEKPGGVSALSRRDLIKRGTLGASGVAAALWVSPAFAAPVNRLQVLNRRLQDEELADEQVIRLADGEPSSFDPGVTGGGNGLEMIQNMFEGLMTINQEDGSLGQGLAEKMEANTDATVFTFTLRDGLMWSDGTPLNAHDFEWSWKRVLDPETKSGYTSALFPIKNAEEIVNGTAALNDLGVSATDDKTLVVTLKETTPYFPLLASTWTYYPVPKHVIDVEKEGWVEAGKHVGNGPYMLTAWEHNQSMTLEQNPNYFGEKPIITRAEYTLFDDPSSQALVPFENDELDQAMVSAGDLDRVKNDETLSKLMQVFPRSGTKFLTCDCSNPPTSDIRVRQALSMAIGRDTLANGILRGQFNPAPTVLPSDIPGNDPTVGLGEDVDKAKQLLADAGFPDGQGFPALKLTYIATEAESKSTAEYLQGVWLQNLNINIELDPLDDKAFGAYSDARIDTPFNLTIDQWASDFADPSNWHNQLFETSADLYHTHWQNDEFNQIVDAARPMTDQTARTAEYTKAEKILNTDLPIIPLFHSNRIFVIKPYVRGIHHLPILGRTWIKYISIVKH